MSVPIVVALGEVACEAVWHRGAGERLAGHRVQVAVRRGVWRDADEIPEEVNNKFPNGRHNSNLYAYT